jgi:hypothetical protein
MRNSSPSKLALWMEYSFAGLITNLVLIFRHKIIIGADFIESVYFFRRKIFFKDIIQVIIDNQQAFVVSREARLHIGQEISGRERFLQVLLARLKQFPYIQIAGDPFIISHLMNAMDDQAVKEKSSAGELQSFAGAVSARLIEKRWLYREFDVRTPRGGYNVIYYGRGWGYECVLVDDEVVDKTAMSGTSQSSTSRSAICRLLSR